MTIDQQHRAIETQYAGTLFRSRLEARWAVVFDHLGIAWEYEPEAFDVGWGPDPTGYLPDFWLPDTKTWAEVKGSPAALAVDNWKLTQACEGGSPLWNMEGSYGTTSGLLILGPLPRSDRPTDPWIVQHHKGVWVNVLRLDTMEADKLNLSMADVADCFKRVTEPGRTWAETALEGCYPRVRGARARWRAALSAGRSARFDPASRRSRYGL